MMTTKTLWNIHVGLNVIGIIACLMQIPYPNLFDTLFNGWFFIWLFAQIVVIYTIYKRKWEI